MSRSALSPGEGLSLGPSTIAVLDLTETRRQVVRAHIAAFLPTAARSHRRIIEMLAACVYVIDDAADRWPGIGSREALRRAFLPWLNILSVKLKITRSGNNLA